MKVKVGQKIRIGKSAKCIKAFENYYLDREGVKPVLGRIATVIALTHFNSEPAVHLKFRSKFANQPGDIRSPDIYWPVSGLRKP